MSTSPTTHNLRSLFTVFTLLILCVYLITLIQLWLSALKDTENSLIHINSAQVQGVYATLKSHELVLKGLGEELFSKGALTNPEKGRELIERMKSIDPRMVAFGLSRPDGQLVLVSGIKKGTPLPNLLQMPETRDDFLKTIKSRHIQIARPYFLKLVGQWAVPIRIPILNSTGEVMAVMTAGYGISASNTGWANIESPAHVELALLRDDGYLQFYYPEPPIPKAEIYGKPVHGETIKQIDKLPSKKGFTSINLARREGAHYVAYQRMEEYGLISASFIHKQRVFELWLKNIIAPSVLLLLYLTVAILTYRRTAAQQKKAQEDLEHLAHHDQLTGLINRYSLHKKITKSIAEKQNISSALMLIDLDKFKEVNDTLGHYIGDKILQGLGPLMQKALSHQSATICRLGGDEFTVFIENISSRAELENIANQLRLAIKKPFEVDSIKLEIDSSIGVALYPQHGADSHELLRSADVAMYKAKSNGDGVKIYDPATDMHSHHRLAMIGEISAAIRDNQLRLHYQPKFDLHTLRVTGFEALVRWQHPRLGLIYPDAFIPLAEVSDVIHALTAAVLQLAIAQQNEWRKAGLSFTVAVNISARNLSDDNCINQLESLLKQSGIVPGQLELEITESSLMRDPEGAISRLNKISSLGVKLSIDDFGTGYSSLAYLRRMPIQTLKIDRTFVKDMNQNLQDEQIVLSTINLAHNLNMQVVAEGVEDAASYDMLKQMGCDLIQGYYFSRPLPWDEIARWMDESPLLKSKMQP